MLFIWRGLGFLVPLIWVASAIATAALLGNGTYEHNGWPKFVASLLAAVAIACIGTKLNRNRPSGNTHSFFFLDVEIWAFISVIGGIFLSAR